MSDEPRARVPTLSDIETLAGMKADVVALKIEAKVEAQKAVQSWLDGRLTHVEEVLRDIKGSVIFWGALPTALVALVTIWAYLHGVRP